MNDLDEKVRIKIISITRNGDEAIRHMVGHIDGVEFIYSDSVDDEMKIRKVLDGVRLSTLVFLVTGIESETDTQVISKISYFTEITHELGALTIAIASASSPKLENKHSDLFATFLCHIDESKTANEVLLESVKSLADLLTHPGIVACDISLFIYTLFAPDSMAFICTETAVGENRAKDVTTKLLNCPLLNNVNLNAAGVYMLVCISTASTLSVLEYEEVTSILGMFQESGSTTMKAGTSINPDLADDEMKVTIAITNVKKYNDESWYDDNDDHGDDDNIGEIPAFLRPQLTRKNKMKIEFLNAQQVGKKLKKLMDITDEFYWAVAWATDIALAKSLLENEDKICQLVIGTDFSQTSPEVLRILQEVENVHIMQSNGKATFHPKVYCFVKGEKVYAIVGSSNLTRGGTYHNEEAAIFMEGTLGDEPLQEILDAVSSWWDASSEIEDDWLNAYELRWDNNQQHKIALEKPIEIYQPNPDAEHSDLLFKTWDDYVAALHDAMNDEDEIIKERLKTLKRAHKLFATGNFDELNEQQRRAIAGLTNGGNLGADLERFGWAAFGNMDRARVFNDAIRNNDVDTIEHISRALDYIPFTGGIFENDYINFKREFMFAFPNGGVAIGCATRLLAMKRPDYFICANGANKERLAADFGFAPSTLNLDNYWERVVEPIIQSRWWNEQRPANDERLIWNTRAAMLDVIYYEW